MELYLIHDEDDYIDRHCIGGVFSSKEKATAYIDEHYPGYTYCEKYDEWEETNGFGYLWISEHVLDGG